MKNKQADKWNNKGATYFIEGKWADAEKCFQKAFELTPDNPTLLNNMGMLAHQKGAYKQAAELYERANQNKASPTYLVNMGNAHAMAGKFDLAKNAYLAALELLPQDEKALLSLAKLAEHRGEVEEAKHYIQELNERVRSPKNRWELANFFYRQKHYNKALNVLYPLVEENPDSAIWLTIGRCEFFLQNFGLAEQALASALKLDPVNGDNLHQMGLIFLAKNEYSPALQCLEKAVIQSPKNTIWRTDLALVLASMEKHEEARKHLEQVLEIEPENEKAKKYHELIINKK